MDFEIERSEEDKKAVHFCKTFQNNPLRCPRYIFGRNDYAESVLKIIEVDGFIDDFTDKTEWLGKPVIRSECVPEDSLVVVAVVGRPLKVKKHLDKLQINHLDYFSFYKHSCLNIKPVTCWPDFCLDFKNNKSEYNWVYKLLADDESKLIFSKIINFRLSSDLKYMEGFKDIQYRQYFEDFLCLNPVDEVFIDVGGFNGDTSLEFIKHCSNFKSIHFFEPEKKNIKKAKHRLSKYSNIFFHQIGLSDKQKTVKFEINGSCSKVSKYGNLEINVDKLDDVINKPFTFIKMDIEGGEADALRGAKQSIIDYHPKIAVSVYHLGNDIWKIPKQILSYRRDYQIYLRHYTEGVDETVMFFIPDKSKK